MAATLWKVFIKPIISFLLIKHMLRFMPNNAISKWKSKHVMIVGAECSGHWHVQMSSARWNAGTPKNLESKQLSQIISRHRGGKKTIQSDSTAPKQTTSSVTQGLQGQCRQRLCSKSHFFFLPSVCTAPVLT